MGCFDLFKRRPKRHQAAAQKQPPTTATTPTFSTSRSDDSGAVGPASKSAASTSSQRSISALYEERGQNLRAFDFGELRAATNDFSRALWIGEGGFGSVYKGFIKPADGRSGDRDVVAVKQLNQRSMQGHKQWLAEVQFLGVLEHPNLVKLIGYCAVDGERGNQRLLVYEFMPNKSLEDHLFSRIFPPLSWKMRLQVILGAAEGLAYLHEGLEIQVIYRDFKASNVLLDKEFNAKLSDFGLAREGPVGDATHVSTAVVGTHGYAAPEYIETGHLTVKSDIWSFGVVLYEILTGRRSLDRKKPAAEEKLLDWVVQYPHDSRNFRMIMDPRLHGEYSIRAAREVARLAEWCLVSEPKDRPTMSEAVRCLKNAINIDPTELVAPQGGGGLNKGKKRSDASSRRQ